MRDGLPTVEPMPAEHPTRGANNKPLELAALAETIDLYLLEAAPRRSLLKESRALDETLLDFLNALRADELERARIFPPELAAIVDPRQATLLRSEARLLSSDNLEWPFDLQPAELVLLHRGSPAEPRPFSFTPGSSPALPGGSN